MKKSPANGKLPHKTVFALILALAAILLASCEMQSLVDGWRGDEANTVYQPLDTSATPTVTTSTPITTEAATTTEPPTTTAPPVTTTVPPVTTAPPVIYYSPLSGLPCSQAASVARPLAFCVRTASGAVIGECDAVIEAPTETSSTRLLLLKCNGYSLFDRLECHSIRPYMVAVANDLFALSIYRGTSDTGKESTPFIYDTLDLSLGSVAASGSLQNALGGYQTTVAGSISLPYSLAPVGKTVTPTDQVSTYVSVPFDASAASTFTYDALTKSYTMRSGAALSTEEATFPAFKNLLILFFDSTRRVTKDGTELTLDTVNGGSGYYLSEGGLMTVLWRRDPETSNLIMTDTDGIPLTVNRGRTYIAMTTFEYRDALILN